MHQDENSAESGTAGIHFDDLQSDAKTTSFQAEDPRTRRYIIARRAYGLVMFAMILAVAVGCGGNGSSQPSPTPAVVTVAPGTYTIQVIASDGTNTAQHRLTLLVQ